MRITNKVSVYGASGFIGSRFYGMFSYMGVPIPRDIREPETNNIINFISTTNNYAFEKDITIDVNTNLIIMLEILKKAKEKYGKEFIFNQVSTWSVYGEVNLPAKEEYPCEPTGFYSISKRAAEQLLMTFSEVYDIPYRIFRLCNVIGETAKKISKYKNSFQYLIKEMRENKPITLYNNGAFIREFMYVEDACNAIWTCIQKGKYNTIYNIGTGIPHYYGDLVEYAKVKLNSTSYIERIPEPFPHGSVQAKNMYLDVSKLNSLGFKPAYTVYDAIDKIIQWGEK